MDIRNNDPRRLRKLKIVIRRVQSMFFILGKTKKFIPIIILLSLFSVSSPLHATESAGGNGQYPVEKEGVVKLVATLQDSPAFTDVVWKLYRLDLPGRPIMTIKRHSAIVSLQPGRYRAVASLQSIIRSRAFNLKSQETREVILPMDK